MECYVPWLCFLAKEKSLIESVKADAMGDVPYPTPQVIDFVAPRTLRSKTSERTWVLLCYVNASFPFR